ncbi:MAG: PaaI family thioesterase [Firmicutes bacterium]|nr:PaaI family thioesterase [Bacillota bacterium]
MMIADKMLNTVGLFEAQPYHQYLGMRVTACSDGFSQVQIEIRPELCNPVGTLHGGIICSLSAIASSLAALSMLDTSQYTVASDFNISVLRPISSGTIVIEGQVIKAGRRLIFVETKVIDVYGSLAAVGRVTKPVLTA